MKLRRYSVVALAGALTFFGFHHYSRPEPTILSFRLGQSFQDVVKNSTYPVMKRSNLPDEDPSGEQFGVTWVTEPAVIIHFADPEHGFILPPTTFASLGFNHNAATTLATSPMLEKLPFDEALVVLENVQNQLKAGGWEPWTVNQSVWFDLSPEGKKRLYERMFEPGYGQTATLRIPKMYGMILRLICARGCWTREPPYKFLVDVGVSSDVEGSEDGDPQIWEPSHPANRPRPSAPARPATR